MKKFKLTIKKEINGITLFQIEALKNYPNGVKKGDKGGWIEKEDNLSNDAWVSGNARVYGDARVYGNARVSGNARVYGDARVYGNARVYGGAWDKSPLQIQGTKHFFNECKKGWIKIGCYEFTINEWLERYNKIGKENGYNEKEIAEYGLYLELAKKLMDL